MSGRKIKDVTITAPGRDTGKQFRITEMGALAAERWGMRAVNTMSKALGQSFPEELLETGMAGLTVMGLSAFMRSNYEDMAPLMDEMLTCVQIFGTPGSEQTLHAPIPDVDIQEVRTLIKLREEVLGLHLDFFPSAVQWISKLIQQKMAGFSETGRDAPTSPDLSLQ